MIHLAYWQFKEHIIDLDLRPSTAQYDKVVQGRFNVLRMRDVIMSARPGESLFILSLAFIFLDHLSYTVILLFCS